VMLALSKRVGMLADRIGPRLFMGAGPLLSAVGLLAFLRLEADVDYATGLLPPLLLFSLGLTATVAPLTAMVLSDADEEHAGIASGVNNAIARAAGLLGIAAIGAVIAAQFAGGLRAGIDITALSPAGRTAVEQAEERVLARADVSGLPAGEGAAVARATETASVDAFHTGMAISAGLVALGGVLGLAFVRNPRREVPCAGCAGGQFAGAPQDAARERPAPAGVAA
ncbi:MAG TPA: MFS transporter, partial [Solirubrobacteraceae bacterium]|nr:MFS transporter [Solirubrobacteraceae bacterium]